MEMSKHTAGSDTEGIVFHWPSKDGFFAKVEALIIVSTLLYAIQVVFGWWRRCSSNVFIHYSLWLAHTLTPFVPTYTFGFISLFIYAGHNLDALDHSDAYLLFDWSISLVFALGGTYSITAYHVDDKKQYTRHLIQHAVYVFNLVAVTRLALHGSNWKVCVFLFEFLFLTGCIITTSASMVATSFSDKESLYLQDYMKTEHLMTTNSKYDPVTLVGYNYPIFEIKRKFVTVNQVCQMDFGSDGTRLKEVCLSYALFRLLRRRFFGAACPEATLQKTHDFVFKGLLSNVEENYQAAYRVIETELAFTHDHFFTSSPALSALVIGSAIWKTVSYLIVILLNALSKSNITKGRCIITAVIMLVLLALELLQLYVYLSSDHARVHLALWSITHLKCCQILRLCNRLPQLFGCWQNKIGQHSLLKDLHRRSITADVIGSLSGMFVFRSPAFPRGIHNPGVKGPDRIPLTVHVKRAIARTLKSSDGHLSNFTSSFQCNGEPKLAEEFLWGRSHASDILIWHIATEYCDIGQSLQTEHRDVATALSSYCAYLVAFVPELLPDHQLETTTTFYRTRQEALQHLREEKTLEAKYAKLSGIIINGQPPPKNGNRDDGQPASEGAKVFGKGIELGKRLESITDDGRRWKILADFWAEMILYIAPSDNARDHIQHLANGGEFITHLWALLTHAGILDRGQRNVANDIENPGDGSSYNSTSTSRAAPAIYATDHPATTGNGHSVQWTERNVGDIENALPYQSYPEDLPYTAALKFWHAGSYLHKCAEGAASTATPANCLQAAGMVQNVEGTSNVCAIPSEIDEAEE